MFVTSKVKWLYIVTFLDLFAVSLAIPLLSAHQRSLGASYFVSGMISSLYAGLQLFSGPVVGSWSDVRGRQSILLITTLICSVCYICTGVTTAIFVLILARAGLGLFKHTQTLCRALVSDLVPEPQQAEVYGVITAIAGAGFIMGPIIGGHLGEVANGFMYICCLVAVLFWVNSGITYMFIPDDCQPSHKSNIVKSRTNDDRSVNGGMLSVLNRLALVNWPHYWDVFSLKFLLGFVVAVFHSEYSTVIQDKFQLTPKWIGYTIAFQGLVGSASGLSIGFLDKIYSSNKNRNLQVFHGFLLLLVSVTCLSLASNLGTFVFCLMPLSISCSLLRIISTELMLERTPTNEKGTIIGTGTSVSSVARLVAPMCAGLVRDMFGTVGVSALSITGSLMGVSLAGIIFKHNTKYKTQ